MAKYSNEPGWVNIMGGPADGECLWVDRAPVYLRAARSSVDGVWSLLDAKNEEPREWEDVWVYRQANTYRVTDCDPHFQGRHYSYVYIQVDRRMRKQLRDTNVWQDWATLRLETTEAPNG